MVNADAPASALPVATGAGVPRSLNPHPPPCWRVHAHVHMSTAARGGPRPANCCAECRKWPCGAASALLRCVPAMAMRRGRAAFAYRSALIAQGNSKAAAPPARLHPRKRTRTPHHIKYRHRTVQGFRGGPWNDYLMLSHDAMTCMSSLQGPSGPNTGSILGTGQSSMLRR